MKINDFQISISLNLDKLTQGIKNANSMLTDIKKQAEKPLNIVLESSSVKEVTKKLRNEFDDIAADLEKLDIGLEYDDDSSRDALKSISEAIDNIDPYVQPIIEDEEAKQAIARLKTNIAKLRGVVELNPKDEKARKALDLLEKKLADVEESRGLNIKTDKVERAKERIAELQAKKMKLNSDTISLRIDTTSIKGAIANLGQLGWAIEGLKRITEGISKIFRFDIGKDFEATMSDVEGTLRATKNEMVLLEKESRRLGSSTAYTAKEALAGAGALGANGQSAKEAKESLEGVLFFTGALSGRGGFGEMAEAAELGVASLKNFNLEAGEMERVADVFVRGTQISSLNAQRLQYAMQYAGTTASVFKHSIEEVTATLALFHQAGVMGERAGTSYRKMMSSLASPTSEAQKALESLGLSLEKINPSKVDIGGILRKFKSVGAESSHLSKEMKLIFGEEYFTSIQRAIEMSDRYETNLAEMNNSAGAAREKYLAQMGNLEGETAKMMSALEEIYLKGFDIIGEKITLIVQKITSFLQSEFAEKMAVTIAKTFAGIIDFFNFIENHIFSLTSLAVAIGVLTVAINYETIAIAALIIQEKLVIFFTNAWKAASLALNAVLNANPIALIITAIGLLVAGISFAIEKTIGWAAAWEYVKGSLLIAWEYIKAFGSFIKDMFLGYIQLLTLPWYTMFTVVQEVFSGVKEIVKNVFGNIGSIMQKIFSGDFKGALDDLKNGFTESFSGTVDNIKSQVGIAVDSIKNSVSSGLNAFDGLGSKTKEIWDATTKAANSASDAAKEVEAQTEKSIKKIADLKKSLFEEDEITLSPDEEIDEDIDAIPEPEPEQDTFIKKLQNRISAVQDFTNAAMGLSDALYNYEIQNLQNKEAEEIEKVQQSTLSEEEKQAKIANIKTKYDKKERAAKRKQKPFLIAEAIANTSMGVAKALGSTIPPFNFALAALVAAAGAVEIATIKAQKFARGGLVKIAKAASGGLSGLLSGPSHANGGIIIEAEGDEYITNKKRVKELGTGFFDFINFAPLPNVKAALSNVPTFPAPPPVPQYAYATGGSVSNSKMDELIHTIEAMNLNLVKKDMRPVVQMKTIDPEARVKTFTETEKRMLDANDGIESV